MSVEAETRPYCHRLLEASLESRRTSLLICHLVQWSMLLLIMQCLALQGKEKVEGVGTGALAAALAYSDFDVSQLATWKAGEPVPFSFLAKTFDAIATTTKRLEIIKTLVGAFRAILATTPEDLLPIVYLCTNQARPLTCSHEGGVLKNLHECTVRCCAQVAYILHHRRPHWACVPEMYEAG